MNAAAAILDRRVLVLNKSWIAIHVASVRRAVSLVYRNLARVVDTDDYSTYDFESWKSASEQSRLDEARCLHAPDFVLRLPEVIQLTRFNRLLKQGVRFSRRNIYERDGGGCQYCGRHIDRSEFTLEHVTPRCRGGTSTWENIVLSCLRCNVRKGSRLPHEAGMKLRKKPVKPRWATHIGVRLGRDRRASWEKFLSDAYWETELQP